MATVLAAAAAGAWQPVPGMKTPWGEKVTPGGTEAPAATPIGHLCKLFENRPTQRHEILV